MSTIEAISYTVSQLAREVGVSADTVRFYEREGLLPAPRRTAAGYRQYDAAMVDRMTFIQGATRLGLSLSDVRDLLAVRDTGVCPCEPAEQHLTRRLAELDEELERMMRLRARWPRCWPGFRARTALPQARARGAAAWTCGFERGGR